MLFSHKLTHVPYWHTSTFGMLFEPSLCIRFRNITLNDMKIRIFAVALTISALLACGCTKDASLELTGSYTYKISGTLTLMSVDLTSMSQSERDSLSRLGIDVSPCVLQLMPEQGQMHVLDDRNNGVIVTFNDILGNAAVASGTVSESSITLKDGNTKTATVSKDGIIPLGSGIVTYSGSGRKYDDMLVIDMTYAGTVNVGGFDMTVISSEVHCVAQHN